MSIALIVAASENHIIGQGNKMPWHLPNELQHFKSITMGKPIIMGRKTFQSIGRPLPGRTNIVISNNPDFSHPGIVTVSNLQQALTTAEQCVTKDKQISQEVMIIGGAFTYQQALPMADRIYFTRIHCHIEGDTFFPELSPNEWQKVSCQYVAADDNNPLAHSYLVYERINSLPRK